MILRNPINPEEFPTIRGKLEIVDMCVRTCVQEPYQEPSID